MKVAVAQITSVLGDLERNIDHHLEYCEKAIKSKADLIVFPELSLTGYSVKDINFSISQELDKTKALDRLKAISKKISVVCGIIEEDENYAIYNSAIFISDGKIIFTHRKVYPPTYGLFEEFRYFSRGKECRTHETKFGKMGLLVCEDLWHLSLPYTLAMDGAQIITGIAASPTRLATDHDKFRNYEINSEQHRAFARILSCYLIFCNRVGYEDGVNFWGGSEVVDPFGNVIAAAKLFDEDIIYADISFEEVRRARHQARHFLDEDLDMTIRNLKRIRKDHENR